MVAARGRCQDGRARQPVLRVSEAALKRPSGLSAALSEQLADLQFRQQHFGRAPRGPRTMRCQYFDGDASPEESVADRPEGTSSGGAPGEGRGGEARRGSKIMQARDMSGITELVENVDASHRCGQGYVFLNGKMKHWCAPNPNDIPLADSARGNLEALGQGHSVVVCVSDASPTSEGSPSSSSAASRRCIWQPLMPSGSKSSLPVPASSALTPEAASVSRERTRPGTSPSDAEGLRPRSACGPVSAVSRGRRRPPAGRCLQH